MVVDLEIYDILLLCQLPGLKWKIDTPTNQSFQIVECWLLQEFKRWRMLFLTNNTDIGGGGGGVYNIKNL